MLTVLFGMSAVEVFHKYDGMPSLEENFSNGRDGRFESGLAEFRYRYGLQHHGYVVV